MLININDVMDSELTSVVIITKYKGKWVYCKHRERTTYELPGGGRAKGETVEETARRVLYEQTGARNFELIPIGVYEASVNGKEYGMLYFSDIITMGPKPANEIARICYLDEHPAQQTYPQLHPRLVDEAKRKGTI